MLFLPRLSSAKLTLSRPHLGGCARISSPRPGGSTFTTSAPASARNSVASGPGSKVEKSSTNVPSSGRMPPLLPPSHRQVIVLPRRHLHLLAAQHGERADDAGARRVRHDHVVDIEIGR